MFSTQQQIQVAIEVLKEGGTVAFPTDTVYGIGANALMDRAVEKVYQVKQRPRHIAMPLLLAEKSELVGVAAPVPEIAWRLANHFWPGGLTLVLRKNPLLSTLATAGGYTVAVRIPNHSIPIALICGLGVPLTGTSANLSGKPSPVTAEEVYRQIGDRVDLIVDGGRCPGAIESTVVDLTEKVPRIVREGALSREAIETVCGVPVV